uniref:TetR/AcrR family transcriptional regulator C-terminal domain-containing protein n=1 Tax=Paenibacillus sp. FSL E2-0202 TaxID=2954505 RepID=UPI00403F3D19
MGRDYRADYNRGTFYKHFESKEALLKEIHDEFLQGIGEALLDPYEGLERIEATEVFPSILQLFEYIEGHKAEFLALSAVERGKMTVELFDRLRESMREDMRIEIEADAAPVDYEIMLSYQMSATVGVIMHWAEVNFKYSASYMAEQLITLVNSKIDHIAFMKKSNG